MTCPLTRNLGTFVSGLRYDDIPSELLPVIRSGFADSVGTMLAGADEPVAAILIETLAPAGDEATILFDPRRRGRAWEAALINGTAAHALDLDDAALRGHPSVAIVPAVVAEAEAINASGKQMIAAYAAGYETWAELLGRDTDTHHEKGWHPTGIFGPIAAAAACASLRGLSPEETTQAISLGASHSSGLTANFGSMAKPYHAGRAAQAGVFSARLAAGGFTAAPDVLEHPLGFLTAVSKAGRIDFESPDRVGKEWRMKREGLVIKKYPVCLGAHCALDGILDLIGKTGVGASEVAQVDVTVNQRHGSILRHHAPQTGLEAKFSMEFAMASALIAGRASVAELDDSFVRRDDVQTLMTKVAVHLEPEDPDRPGFSKIDRVVVHTRDGRNLDSGRLTTIRGGPESPLSVDELWQKFEGCAGARAWGFEPRALFDALITLDDLPSVRVLPGYIPAHRP